MKASDLKIKEGAYLFHRIEKLDHYYYLECGDTHKYLAQSRRSEFLLRYCDRTAQSVYPVTFETKEQAITHKNGLTRRTMQNLNVKPVASFFSQYLLGRSKPRVNLNLEG